MTEVVGVDANAWQCAKMDLARYGGWRALWREQSLWAVLWFRLGQILSQISISPIRKIALLPWYFVFRLIEGFTGVSLPLEAKIGGGLRIWHFGGIFVHSNTTIGRNCTLRQGVTLGNRYSDGPAPTLGDDVELGAYAQVLGGVVLGHKVKIGALSVVLCDVPEGCTAVGAPAKILVGKQE